MESQNILDARLSKLLQYDIEYSKLDDEYTGLAKLASVITDSPIALITFVESDGVYFKAHIGTEIKYSPLANSFCIAAISNPNQILEVEDTSVDSRFREHHLVKDSPYLKSYFGCPIISPDGIALGTVCVLDIKSKKINNQQKDCLRIIANQVVQLLESKKNNKEIAHQQYTFQQETIRLKNIIEASNVGTWEWDVQTNETFYNERWASMLGYKLDELQPLSINTWENLIDKEDLKNINIHLQKCFNKEIEFYDIECKMLHKNGTWIWVQDRGKVIEWSSDGKPLRMFGTHTDITIKKDTELAFLKLLEELKSSQKRYSDLFQMSPQPMYVFDLDTLRILDANDAALKSYGYTREEFLGLTIKDIRPPEDVEQLESTLSVSKEMKTLWSPGVYRHLTKNKQIKYVEIHSAPIRFGKDQAKIILANDISEHIHRFNIIAKQNNTFKEISWMQSHQTRAPLARILGITELLINNKFDDKELNEFIQLLKLSSQELDEIIKDISYKLSEIKDQ